MEQSNLSLSPPPPPPLSLSLFPPSLVYPLSLLHKRHIHIMYTHVHAHAFTQNNSTNRYTYIIIMLHILYTHTHWYTCITQNLVPLRIIIFHKVTQTCVWYRNVTVVLVIPSPLAGSPFRVMSLTPVPSAALSLAQ